MTSVKDGVEIISEAGESFHAIVGAVNTMTSQNQEISATSEQISASAEEVSASVNEISNGANGLRLVLILLLQRWKNKQRQCKKSIV